MSPPADQPETTTNAAPGRERLFYRDADEFNKAMDAASESIRKAAGPDVLGNALWWGLLVLQAVLYGTYWIFHLDIRHSVIPPVR